jgi:hypothetical protein
LEEKLKRRHRYTLFHAGRGKLFIHILLSGKVPVVKSSGYLHLTGMVFWKENMISMGGYCVDLSMIGRRIAFKNMVEKKRNR